MKVSTPRGRARGAYGNTHKRTHTGSFNAPRARARREVIP